nr:NADH dehydrogenase subunit 6 [Thylacodes adamsii]
MTAVVFSSLFMCLSFLFPVMAQPLSLGCLLLLLTLVACLLSGLILSSWYGYILFLVYVGGLLVMFAYSASLIPNIKFGSLNLIYLVVYPLVFSCLYFYFFVDSTQIISQHFTSQFKFFGMELASSVGISMLVGLAVILFLNLVAVVKICYFRGSALRSHST